MSVILILILASLAVALAFLGGFIWAVKSGQFEDTCTPAMRILSEDEPEKQNVSGSGNKEGVKALKRQKGQVTVQAPLESPSQRSADIPVRLDCDSAEADRNVRAPLQPEQ